MNKTRQAQAEELINRIRKQCSSEEFEAWASEGFAVDALLPVRLQAEEMKQLQGGLLDELLERRHWDRRQLPQF